MNNYLQLHKHLIWGSQLQQPMKRLELSDSTLGTFFNGGLPIGHLIEIGIPLGKEGRSTVLQLLSQASQDVYILWNHGHVESRIFPPTVFAHGICPKHIRFSETVTPVAHLKRAIAHPLFKIIVLDSNGRDISSDDCAFLHHQAKKNQQAILILRPYLLSNKKGNSWATLRFNIWTQHHTNTRYIQVIRGLSERQLKLEVVS